MAHYEIDISEFDPLTKGVLNAALMHARQHRETRTHTLQLQDFYQLAGLTGEVYVDNFMGLVCEVMKAVVCSPDYEEGSLRCWPVFDSIMVTKNRFEFVVNPNGLDAVEFPLRPDQVKAMMGAAPN
ncbi:hypothetical protein [Duganella sp. Dugasp56]|uniref:hypothetical protein n=1 Tax=Duganella sp. Dugasp56 TaxID=3243046 RepID=UPI0039AFCFF7